MTNRRTLSVVIALVLLGVGLVVGISLDLEGSRDLGATMRGAWQDLGSARGFVVGAVVTVIGFIVNNRSVDRLERKRFERQVSHADQQWSREQERDLHNLRRKTYGEVLAVLPEAWYVRRIVEPEEQRRRVAQIRSQSAALVQQVRLCSDDEAVISSAIEFGKQVVLITTENTNATRRSFNSARLDFVEAARSELGFTNHSKVRSDKASEASPVAE